jgi:hypothetical protein
MGSKYNAIHCQHKEDDQAIRQYIVFYVDLCPVSIFIGLHPVSAPDAPPVRPQTRISRLGSRLTSLGSLVFTRFDQSAGRRN